MNYTKIRCMNNNCANKAHPPIMQGHGGSFGGRVEYANLKCPECGVMVMIMPIEGQYTYSISAKTEEEMKEERIKKAIIESEIELAKTITRIKEKGY